MIMGRSIALNALGHERPPACFPRESGRAAVALPAERLGLPVAHAAGVRLALYTAALATFAVLLRIRLLVLEANQLKRMDDS